MDHPIRRRTARAWESRSRRGVAVRLVVLAFLTAGVTWYARQGRNNPFAAIRTVEVRTTGMVTIVHCRVRGARPNGETAVVMPGPGPGAARTTAAALPKDRAWTLVTLGPIAESPSAPFPPAARWVYIGRNEPPSPPLGGDTSSLPSPPATDRFSDGEQLDMTLVYPLADSTRAIDIAFGKLRVLAIPSTAHVPDSVTPGFRELYDLVVVGASDRCTAESLRRCLRPRRLVFAAVHRDTCDTRDQAPNLDIIAPGSPARAYRKHVRGRLVQVEPGGTRAHRWIR